MRRLFSLAVLLLAFVHPTASALGADGWTRLHLGMTPEEAIQILGDPLIRTSGSGFEVWIYDHDAEVLFYGGPVIGWTSPGIGPSGKRTVDVWQASPAGPDAPKFILPRWQFPPKRVGAPNRPSGAEQDFRVPLYRPWQ